MEIAITSTLSPLLCVKDKTLAILEREGFPVSEALKRVVITFFTSYQPNDEEGERFELGLGSVQEFPWQNIHYWSDCVHVSVCPVGLDLDDRTPAFFLLPF